MKRILLGIVGALAFIAASHVAATTSWTYTSTVATGNCNSLTCNNGVGLGSGAGTANVSAGGWSNTNGTSTAVGAENAYLLETAYTTSLFGGGLGMYNKDGCALAGALSNCDASEEIAPEHATDNNGRYDMILLTFSKQVSLRQVSVGWFQTDSDITVLAFSAVGNPGNGNVTNDASLATKSWSTMSGWTAIGSYSNLVTDVATSINANKLYSSSWLVGAYNPIADTNPATSGWTTGNDYVKLKTFAGCVYGDTSSTGCTNPPSGQVPEPGSLALIGLAMAGMVSLRRRKKS